jgi:hypothetical protein
MNKNKKGENTFLSIFPGQYFILSFLFETQKYPVCATTEFIEPAK